MTLLLLALLGGWVALDNVSVVQSMVSRPLPAAFVAGLVVGDPILGAQVGAFLELFLLVAVPAGGGRTPEGGTAAVAAVAAATAAGGPAGLALGVCAGLMWGVVAGWSQTRLRELNGRLVPVPGDGPVSAALVSRAVLAGIALDFLRGVVLAVAGALAAWSAVPGLARRWPLDGMATRGFLLVGAMISLGVVLQGQTRPRRALVLFAAGVALGVVAWGGLP